MRTITPEQADRAYDILVREAGATGRPSDRWSFVYHVARSQRPTEEYRFMGALGFGGKFRNNGNRDDTPYVDCYPESLTAQRDVMITRTNKALAELFNPNPEAATDG
jgi:hypothetical protein